MKLYIRSCIPIILISLVSIFGISHASIKDGISANKSGGVKKNAIVTTTMAPVAPTEFNDDLSDPPYYPLPGSVSATQYRNPLRPPSGKNYPLPHYETKLSLASQPLNVIPMPSPVLNFDGASKDSACTGGNCGSGWPPNSNGDVGPSQYIQAVNGSYIIYNKSGARMSSFTEDWLWTSIVGGTNVTETGPCSSQYAGSPGVTYGPQGEPIVIYDPIGDRWILTHVAYGLDGSGNPVAPFYQCIAVSKTNNPIPNTPGYYGWWRYALRMDPGGDGLPPQGTIISSPKFGVWPDCLYMSAREFIGTTYRGSLVAAFSRTDLEAGKPLSWTMSFIEVPDYMASDSGCNHYTQNPDSCIFRMLPANLQGSAPGSLPAEGSPNYYVSTSFTKFGFDVRTFQASNNCSTGVFEVTPAIVETGVFYTPPSINPPVSYQQIVPQGNSTILLDAIDDHLLQKAQYRKTGSSESLWVVHNVLDGGRIMPEWAQIDVTGGVAAIIQSGLHQPNADLFRWMGSLAIDKDGNMALGYSTSSDLSNPGIAYSGRLSTDDLGLLPFDETFLVPGVGSQNNTCGGAPCSLWGEYSAMSVDPSDECTFWYTNQYYSDQTNGDNGNWQTRVGTFRLPTCDPYKLVKKLSGGYYSSINSAYNALSSSGSDTLQLQAITYYGNFAFSAKTFLLDGGYDALPIDNTYVPADKFNSSSSSGYSAIKGSITISGTAEVELNKVVVR